MRISIELVEADVGADWKAWHGLRIASPLRWRPPGRRLASELDQVARERNSVAVGVKRLTTVAQQHRDTLQVIQQRELSGRVVPVAGVIEVHPRRQRRQGLYLQAVLPPSRAHGQPVALAQVA